MYYGTVVQYQLAIIIIVINATQSITKLLLLLLLIQAIDTTFNQTCGYSRQVLLRAVKLNKRTLIDLMK